MPKLRQKKRTKKVDGSKTIRVNREVANQVSARYPLTGVPAATFFTIAAKEKMEREPLPT